MSFSIECPKNKKLIETKKSDPPLTLEFEDEEDYDDLVSSPMIDLSISKNDNTSKDVDKIYTPSNTAEYDQESNSNPPPTPQESMEVEKEQLYPTDNNKQNVKNTGESYTLPGTTTIKHNTRQNTTLLKRVKKNIKESSCIKVYISTSFNSMPKIIIKNKFQVDDQSINPLFCKRHFIVILDDGTHSCIDCDQETFKKKDYICNKALNITSEKFNHKTSQRGILNKYKKKIRIQKHSISKRGRINYNFIKAATLQFILNWIIPPMLIVFFFWISDYMFINFIGE